MATRSIQMTRVCPWPGSGPRESGDRFEVLYWSAFRERWRPVGPFGGMVLSLIDALEFIAKDPMDCFWH